jgi:hypothetical protein
MLYTALGLACLTALAVAVPVPPAALPHVPSLDARLPEPRLNMEDVSTALSGAQADFIANVENVKEVVLNALNPAQVDPADVTDIIVSHPLVGEEHKEAIGTAVEDLHGHLTDLHASGFVDPGEARWALGLQDLIEASLGWYTTHVESPLSTVVDDVGEQLGSDVSYVPPAVKSMFAYLADLLGSASIFLVNPSVGSAGTALQDAISGPKPDVLDFLQQVLAMSGCV